MGFLPYQDLRGLAGRVLDDPDDACISECSYELRLGSPAYLTRSEQERNQELGKYRTPGLVDLDDLDYVSIPPGKFALLLTKETVSIPHDCIGLISIKAKKKWNGLVNVSGFHVDPGFKGQLLFSVLNAGPTDIILRKGERFFLLFLAQLTAKTEKPYDKPAVKGMNIDVLQAMSVPLASLQTLAYDMSHLTSKLDDAKSASESAKHRAEVSLGVAILSISLALGSVWALIKQSGGSDGSNRSHSTESVPAAISVIQVDQTGKTSSLPEMQAEPAASGVAVKGASKKDLAPADSTKKY